MKVCLWSDSTGFPSIPLMKLSAYHKSRGDTVEMIGAGESYDKVYLSRCFNLPGVKKIPRSPPSFKSDEVCIGGSGYAIELINGKEVFNNTAHTNLPLEIEHTYPDYTLYPEYKDTAYGFLTRGCCNNCDFCIVSKKKKDCVAIGYLIYPNSIMVKK